MDNRIWFYRNHKSGDTYFIKILTPNPEIGVGVGIVFCSDIKHATLMKEFKYDGILPFFIPDIIPGDYKDFELFSFISE